MTPYGVPVHDDTWADLPLLSLVTSLVRHQQQWVTNVRLQWSLVLWFVTDSVDQSVKAGEIVPNLFEELRPLIVLRVVSVRTDAWLSECHDTYESTRVQSTRVHADNQCYDSHQYGNQQSAIRNQAGNITSMALIRSII